MNVSLFAADVGALDPPCPSGVGHVAPADERMRWWGRQTVTPAVSNEHKQLLVDTESAGRLKTAALS